MWLGLLFWLPPAVLWHCKIVPSSSVGAQRIKPSSEWRRQCWCLDDDTDEETAPTSSLELLKIFEKMRYNPRGGGVDLLEKLWRLSLPKVDMDEEYMLRLLSE